ncbi:MAG: baseplate J/gp47 family protein, partial [Chloroflexi bacterium]|nr:baseplate J/gp47 family protein [Chloroflexota bacterium]
RWERRENLIAYTAADGRMIVSAPDARDYYVQFDENDGAYVIFGDGAYGRRPPVGTNNIRARYRVGGGAAGNVPVGAIAQPKTTIVQLDTVSNPAPAAGGADRESVEHAVRFGPQAFRSGQRAVTLDDFVALAHQAGGVARARASSSDWNQIDLYVAPEGDSCRPVPEGLRRRLLAYFEERRMVGTTVEIRDALCVPIQISVDVVIDRRFQRDSVLQAVEDAMHGLLAFRNVDFGQSIYLSDIYGTVEALPGVTAANVTRFRRADSPAQDFEEQISKLPGGLDALPEFLRQAIRLDLAAGGRVEIDAFEIPTLGDLVVHEVTQ